MQKRVPFRSAIRRLEGTGISTEGGDNEGGVGGSVVLDDVGSLSRLLYTFNSGTEDSRTGRGIEEGVRTSTSTAAPADVKKDLASKKVTLAQMT